MRLEAVFILIFMCSISFCHGLETDVEERGKKKKIALFVYVLDLIVKKFFVLKLIYAVVFWIVIHKAGYFLSWFISYLKEKKQDHHEHHTHHPHYGPHHHYEYEYSAPPSNYVPYKRNIYDLNYYDPLKNSNNY